MKTIITQVLIVFILASCSPIYYAPNAQNVPLFKEKNDFKISAQYSMGEDMKAIEIQTAYSIDSLFAIQLNGMQTIKNEKANGSYMDLAIGHYKNLPNNWVFEIYVGFGSGTVKWRYGDSYNNNIGLNNPSSKVKFNKLFVQPNIGYASNHFEFAFSYRIGILSYTSITTQDIPATNEFDLNVLNDTHLMSEPALTLRVGGELVKLKAQLGYSVDLNNDDFKYNQDNWNLNFGLKFSLNKRTLEL